MKRWLFVLLCLVTGTAFAQTVAVSLNTEAHFKNALSHLELKDREMLQSSGNTFGGIAIFAYQLTDTLNKKEFIKPSGRIKIIDVPLDGQLPQGVKEENDKYYIPSLYEVAIKDDTLALSNVFMADGSTYKITKTKVVGVYEEYDKYDAKYAVNL